VTPPSLLATDAANRKETSHNENHQHWENDATAKNDWVTPPSLLVTDTDHRDETSHEENHQHWENDATAKNG